MNMLLWTLQGLLALAFLGTGGLKVVRRKQALEQEFPWIARSTAAQVKAIGVVEVLGAAGIILPAATGIATVLTPLAAAGLALTMAIAIVVHLRIQDPPVRAVPAAVLLILAAVVAWGRLVVVT